jgi:hypothetical protein
MNVLDKIDNFLNEDNDIKLEDIIVFDSFNDKGTKMFIGTDGKGNYTLANDNSVFISDSKKAFTKVDGKPNCSKKDIEYSVFKYKGKFGIFDSNLKLIQQFKNMDELENVLDDIKSDYKRNGEYDYVTLDIDLEKDSFEFKY